MAARPPAAVSTSARCARVGPGRSGRLRRWLACCLLVCAVGGVTACSDDGSEAEELPETIAPAAPAEPTPPAPNPPPPPEPPPAAEPETRTLREVVLEQSRRGLLPLLTVRGRELSGTGDIAEILAAPVDGWLATGRVPSASVSFDGRQLAYQTWRGSNVTGVARVRIRDLRTGRDRPLPQGTVSMAWRDDGALAYFQGNRKRYDRSPERWVGNIFVRPAAGEKPDRWTFAPGLYLVFGWAAERLVATEELQGGGSNVLVLDRPGRVRDLGRGEPVALSPDGTRVLISGFDDAGRASARLVELATGDVLDRVPGVAVVSGDWRGDLVVASGANAELVLMRVRGDRLRVLRRVPVGRALNEPRFADVRRRWIVAGGATGALEGDSDSQPIAVVCRLADATCVDAEPTLRGTSERLVYGHSVGARLPDGRYFGYIRELLGAASEARIVFDRAEHFGGANARRAALRDGVADIGDFYLRNWSASAVVLPLAPSTRVTRVDCPNACVEDVPSSLRELARAVRLLAGRGLDRPGGQFWVTVRRGEVVAIDEMYLP